MPIRIRKRWRRSPATRIKKSVKLYSRKKNNVKVKKMTENGL